MNWIALGCGVSCLWKLGSQRSSAKALFGSDRGNSVRHIALLNICAAGARWDDDIRVKTDDRSHYQIVEIDDVITKLAEQMGERYGPYNTNSFVPDEIDLFQ